MRARIDHLTLLMICLIVSPCYAENSSKDLYNDELFEQSEKQIKSMSVEELDELRDYLSSCGTRARGEAKQYFCERSTRRYLLKYGQGAAVEKMILALSHVDGLIEIFDAMEGSANASESQKMMIFKDVERYSKIREMMESAMKLTYTRD